MLRYGHDLIAAPPESEATVGVLHAARAVRCRVDRSLQLVGGSAVPWHRTPPAHRVKAAMAMHSRTDLFGALVRIARQINHRIGQRLQLRA